MSRLVWPGLAFAPPATRQVFSREITMQSAPAPHHLVANPSGPGPWRLTTAGLCASLVGIGMARFAYTPLLPAIISAHWFPASTAAYLGAANLGGYLAGALLGGPMARRMPAATVLRAMMLLATVAFFACAFPISFLWFFVWRFASGISGGALMVLAAPTVLPHIAPARRGLTSGAIFMGVGLGIAASGTIVPILLSEGVMQTWVGLGVLSLVLTLFAWNGWPKGAAPGFPAAQAKQRHALPVVGLRALYLEYALNAAGLVPHMIFLVDFVARGLGKGLNAGSEYWVLFGLGAVVGPVVFGHLADRTGFRPALRVAFLLEAVAVAIPALGLGPGWLMVSSVVVGAFTPGIVPLVLGRINELLVHHPASQKSAWSMATTCFAVLQAGGAYGMSFLFVHSGGNYTMLFVMGAVAMALALVIDLVMALVGEGSTASA
jgi:predicted MFS family arabinose efflux permease